MSSQRRAHGPIRAALVILLSIAVASCAAPFGRPAPGQQTVGVASWYGPGFHGRRTASGAVYDQDGATAAHRTLPFGTRVRVTNLDNGRAMVLTVNDRGPFVRGRIIDVSRRAAERLGFRSKGLARVRVEIVALGET